MDRQAPEIPFWDADWGQTLLDKGDADGAIAKLSQAHRKGPHFADPLELWGEALMLSGRNAEARAQYVAANGMDLSKPDRAALIVLLARTASGALHG